VKATHIWEENLETSVVGIDGQLKYKTREISSMKLMRSRLR